MRAGLGGGDGRLRCYAGRGRQRRLGKGHAALTGALCRRGRVYGERRAVQRRYGPVGVQCKRNGVSGTLLAVFCHAAAGLCGRGVRLRPMSGAAGGVQHDGKRAEQER